MVIPTTRHIPLTEINKYTIGDMHYCIFLKQ